MVSPLALAELEMTGKPLQIFSCCEDYVWNSPYHWETLWRDLLKADQ